MHALDFRREEGALTKWQYRLLTGWYSVLVRVPSLLMAVAVYVRVVIALAAVGTRVVRVAEGPGADQITRISRNLWDRLHDPGESDADLSAAVAAESDRVADVATYNDPFELRRLQAVFTQKDALVASDDARILTIDYIKLAAGAPVSSWDAADLTGIRTRFETFWTTLKPEFSADISLTRMKIYKLGPAVFPPQVPVYDATVASPATGSATPLPPQCACSVTEKAGSKQFWGRFFLPPPGVTRITQYGRFTTAFLTLVADAADVMYEGARVAGTPAVVYRRPLPVRQQKNGVQLPARSASAWTVDDLQVDDIVDVIRSRRWKTPLLRTQRQVAA
jgi:hypothetical protein